MTKLVKILTVPEERIKFAHRLGVFGIAVGVVALALLSTVALNSAHSG